MAPEGVVSPVDLARIREDFPILGQRVHGKALVYLDNAATTQKPRAVLEALSSFYTEFNSNVHRGVHQLSQRATDAYEGARVRLQRYLNARQAREIIFVRGVTEAVNLVAQTYGRTHVGAGDEVLISAMEHHSNIVPWQMLCQEKSAHLRVIPMNRAGELLLEEYERLLTPRTRLVALVHVSNALGTINPVRQMIEMAHARSVPVLVDGAQAAGHMPVDVVDLDADFYALSGHKMYGPTGIGVLYGKADLLESMPPYQGGGDMIRSVTFEKTTYNALPHRLEAGTPNIAGAIGLGAAAEYLCRLGREWVSLHEQELLTYATRRLSSIDSLRLIGTASRKGGVLSFLLDGIHAHDVGTILDQQGVAIRTGHHCAQPIMDFFGVPATARASFGVYNVEEEVDALVEGIDGVSEVFR